MRRGATSAAGLRIGGYVPELVLRVVLLALVVGQLVFLAGRHRIRVDLTADRLYTLTDSTREILEGLEDRLLIECYFSSDDKLPAAARERRTVLKNFLDEYVQLGNGKVVVDYLDPGSDKLLQEKAERIGIQPETVSDPGDASLTYTVIWQGMRLMYGADKQKVIPKIGWLTPFQYEAVLTPFIKDLTVKEKSKIGLIAYATESGAGQTPFQQRSQGQSIGFDRLATMDQIKGRYEVERIYWDDGRHIADDIKTLLLARPKKLTDRQKYVLDQFLMRGGRLVVFADTAEYEVGQRRTFRRHPVSYDADGAELKFLDQLAHYGVDVDDQVIADCASGETLQGLVEPPSLWEDFRIQVMTPLGPGSAPIAYPYWFHAVDVDYGDPSVARRIARVTAGGNGVDESVVEQYQEVFEPGIDTDHPVLKAMGRGPALFWPCAVELAEKLPEGVQGEVLMRTSPIAIAQEPPEDLNPLGFDPSPQQRNQALQEFHRKLSARVASEPRRQYGLMAHLSGSFPSFFRGKDIPPLKKEEESAPQEPPDPLEQPIGVPPIEEEEGGAGAEAPGKGAADAPADEPGGKKGDKDDGLDDGPPFEPRPSPGDEDRRERAAAPQDAAAQKGEKGEAEGAREPDAQDAKQDAKQDTEAPQEPDAQEGAEVQGPPGAAPEGEEQEEQEPAFVERASEDARLIVIGDADFVRDDLTRFDYAQAGGPYCRQGSGIVFYAGVLDWLSEDQELLALSSKTVTDRTIKLADESFFEDLETASATIKAKGKLIRWANIVLPAGIVLLLWLIVAVRRHTRKEEFLASVGD